MGRLWGNCCWFYKGDCNGFEDIRFKIRNNTKTLVLGFMSLVLHENIILEIHEFK